MPAPVPVRKASSAVYRSPGSSGSTDVSRPDSRARSRIVPRVMPASEAVVGGVRSRLPVTMNTFAPVASATRPLPSSISASPAPALFACTFASTLSR